MLPSRGPFLGLVFAAMKLLVPVVFLDLARGVLENDDDCILGIGESPLFVILFALKDIPVQKYESSRRADVYASW